MKVELINTIPGEQRTGGLDYMVKTALGFFDQYIRTAVKPMDGGSLDIVADKSGVELGSYGIRTNDKVGSWIYGTGVAEPRLSTAMQNIEDILVPFTHAYGDLMTFEEFKDAVEDGVFIDDDGSGDWATSEGYYETGPSVFPSDLSRENFVKPDWATHVMWYNR
jgi:hypothetical protein